MVTVDIGTSAIKIAEFGENGKLNNYVILGRFARPFYSTVNRLVPADAVAVLKLGLQKGKIKSRTAAAALPPSLVFTSIAHSVSAPPSLPSMTMAGFESGPGKNFLIAVPTDTLRVYHDILSAAGLKITEFELENLSLARLLTAGKREVSLIIDIGGRSTHFTVAQNGLAKFIAHTDFAGSSLTESPYLTKEILDVLLRAAKQTEKGFKRIYGQEIHNAILCGGGAKIPAVLECFKKAIGMPVKAISEFDPSLAVAIGLRSS